MNGRGRVALAPLESRDTRLPCFIPQSAVSWDDAPSPHRAAPPSAKCNIMDKILSLYSLGTLPRNCFKGKAGYIRRDCGSGRRSHNRGVTGYCHSTTRKSLRGAHCSHMRLMSSFTTPTSQRTHSVSKEGARKEGSCVQLTLPLPFPV